jgi:hypothetical protein
MRKSKLYFLLILPVLLSGVLIANGQDTAWWPLTSAGTPSIKGNVSANNLSFSSVLSTSGQGGYTVDGFGTSKWDSTTYYEFAVKPIPGYSLIINSISSTNKLSYSGPVNGIIRYSYDSVNFNSTFQQAASFVVSGTATDFSQYVNIPVSSGSKIYFRVYVFNVISSKFFYCKNFKLTGSSSV